MSKALFGVAQPKNTIIIIIIIRGVLNTLATSKGC